MNYMFMPLKRYSDFSGRSRRQGILDVDCSLIAASDHRHVADRSLMILDDRAASAARRLCPTSYADFGDGSRVGRSSDISARRHPASLISGRRSCPSSRPSRSPCGGMHDQDKSGWLHPDRPFVSASSCSFLFSRARAGPNRFGPDPKGGGGRAGLLLTVAAGSPRATREPAFRAPVAELVDALDSKSSSARSARSTRARGTTIWLNIRFSAAPASGIVRA